MSAFTSFCAELRENPVLWRLVLVSACAAFGSALPDVVAVVRQVLA